MSGFQPVDRIAPRAPVPSILTSATDRSADGFGTAGVAPGAEAQPGGDPVSSASWRTGISWTPVSCHPSHNWARCPEPDAEKAAAVGLGGPVHTDRFTIYTPLACDWKTERLGEALAADATDLTVAHTAAGVAAALWLGDGLPDDPDQPTLRRNATDVSINGAAAPIDDVFAVLLTEWWECTGGNGRPVLHVPSELMAYIEGGGIGGAILARRQGDLFTGPLGSIVSPGPGYPNGVSSAGVDGFGPQTDPGPPALYAGNTATEAWIYITGPVEYAVADPIVLPPDELERRNLGRPNTYEVWGERDAIVRFDPCCSLAALALNPAPVS